MFPTSTKWGAEACRATNHLHRPDDFADEWRVTLDLVRRLSAYAHEHGVMLSRVMAVRQQHAPTKTT